MQHLPSDLQNTTLQQLQSPISDEMADTIDYAICKRGSSYLLLLWKKNSSCYCAFRTSLFGIEPEYPHRNMLRLHPHLVAQRIQTGRWNVIAHGVYQTRFIVIRNNREIINENYRNYPQTYERIVSIRNLQNQLYKVVWETTLYQIYPSIAHLLVQKWLLQCILRRRHRRVCQELQFLPPIVNNKNIVMFPGGMQYQTASVNFYCASANVTNESEDD